MEVNNIHFISYVRWSDQHFIIMVKVKSTIQITFWGKQILTVANRLLC